VTGRTAERRPAGLGWPEPDEGDVGPVSSRVRGKPGALGWPSRSSTPRVSGTLRTDEKGGGRRRRQSAAPAPAAPAPAGSSDSPEPSDEEDPDDAEPNVSDDPDEATSLQQSKTRIRHILDDAHVSDLVAPPRSSGVSRETEIDTPIAREAEQAMRVLNPARTSVFPRPPERRIITIANQKGGVGKTTSAVNLAVAMALHGLRILVVDLDPQGNASTGLGVDHSSGVPSAYEVLIESASLADTAVAVAEAPNLWCIPATIDLAGAEVELVTVVARETRLRTAINGYHGDVDYIFVDCPPSLGLLTINALVAADEVFIPIQCEYYALEGLGQLLRNIELIKAHLNDGLRLTTILLTMYDARTKLADQVAQEVRNHFGDLVLDVVIPRSVRVSEAPGYGQSVMTYDPGSRGALTYLEAAREIAERGARRRPDAGGEPATTIRSETEERAT
jgi:chromosome partitioning protein